MPTIAAVTVLSVETWLRRIVPKPRRRDSGASLVEYGLLVALIAIVCFAAVVFFGGETSETFSRVGDSVQKS